jgi:hypothetical protein
VGRLRLFILEADGDEVVREKADIPPEDQAFSNRRERVEDNIALSIATDKAVYGPGEIVNVMASVENRSSRPISYTLRAICHSPLPAVGVSVKTPFDVYQGLHTLRLPLVVECAAAEERRTLGAGEKVIRKVFWDRRIRDLDNLYAPDGQYEIMAGFAESKENEWDPITCTVGIEIGGAGAIINGEEALRMALSVPEDQKWVEEHSGPSLVRKEAEQWYVHRPWGWVKVSAEGAEWIKEKKPAHYVSMKGSSWMVLFQMKMGDPPHQVSVKVDARTGQVLAVERLDGGR